MDEQPDAIALPAFANLDSLGLEVRQAIETAEADRAKFLKQLDKNRKLMRGEQPRRKKPWPNSCDMVLKVCRWVKERMMAQVSGTFFASHPYFLVDGQRAKDDKYSGVVERLLENLLVHEIGFETEMDPVFQGIFDDSSAGVYLYWFTDEREVMRRILLPAKDEFDGEVAWKVVPTQEMLYDGPKLKYYAIDEFGVVPADARDIQSAQGFYMVDTLTGQELLQARDRGEVDADQLAKLQDWYTDNPASMKQTRTVRGISTHTATSEHFQESTFDIYKAYWLVHKKVDHGQQPDASQDYLLWVHKESGTILHAEPNPSWSQSRRMIVLRAFPDKRGIYGDSIADIVGDVQQTMVAILQQSVDQASISIHPPIAMDEQSYLDGEPYVYAPGAIWKVRDPSKIKQIVQPSQLQVGTALIEFLRQIVERYTGVSDNSMGMSGDRKTATESQVLSSNASLMFNLIIARLRPGMNEIARQLLELCYEHAGNASVQRLIDREEWGGDDPQLALNEALGGRYFFNATGSVDTSSKPLRQAVMREIYDRLIQNPLVAQNPLLMFSLTRRYLTELGVLVPEELIGKEKEVKAGMAEHAQANLAAMGVDQREQALAQQEAEAATMKEQAGTMVQGAMEQMTQVPA